MNFGRVQNTTKLILVWSFLFHCFGQGLLLDYPNANMKLEPNPPLWPNNVLIVHDTDDMNMVRCTLKQTEDSYNEDHGVYTTDHHFSDRRWAILFAPGVYRTLDFEIGYYVQVAGLGTSPDDVIFTDCAKGPHVPALNGHIHTHGISLDTFWRSAENFRSEASQGMMWAVSQAAPLRRVHVTNDLYLHDGAAYASGGHLANSIIDGHAYFGGQQQYLSRNVEFRGGASGGAWSLVFVGCTGEIPEPSAGTATSPSITVTENPPIRIEKPYIALQKQDRTKYELHVPVATREEAKISGPSIHSELEEIRDFSNVRVIVASSEYDPITDRIQEALDDGKDVVLSPGVYHLTRTIQMMHDNQVLLGLGLATLKAPPDGLPCLHVVPGTSGVRLAGIMLEARTSQENARMPKTSTLLEWGQEGVQDPGNPSNPGAMFDIFCRVGGGSWNRPAMSIDTMMRIHSGHVVGDNIWLWRADHSELAKGEEPNYPNISPIFHQNEENENRVETGIHVFGDDVTFYGLAVEHANGHQTVWSGERGCVHFYQCEFPYDVARKYGSNRYRGYLVTDTVRDHTLLGAGIYSNFRNEVVEVEMAIQYPQNGAIQCINPFTVHLDNKGGILSVANGIGGRAVKKGTPVRI